MRKPWEPVITVPILLDLYAEGMKRGGKSSAPREGCLEQCLGGACTAEAYESPDNCVELGFAFAAYLLFYLARAEDVAAGVDFDLAGAPAERAEA